MEIIHDIEKYWNHYVSTGIFPPSKYVTTPSSQNHQRLVFLSDSMRNNNARLVLEKFVSDMDFDRRKKEVKEAILNSSLDYAIKLQERFSFDLGKIQSEREERVVEDLYSLSEPTLVIFGVGHPTLVESVSANRRVEVHYPFSPYNDFYDTLMQLQFRKTGRIDRDLFLRSYMQELVYLVLKDSMNLSPRENLLVASHYASTLGQTNIVEFFDYYRSTRDFLVGVNDKYVIESFLAKNHYPSIEEVKANLPAENH